MSVRKIEWAGLGRMGERDTDGERATYMTPDGSIYFGDLAGHSRSLVFKGGPDAFEAVDAVASRDFSMVAFNMPAKPGRPATVAVVKIDGTGYRELVRDDAGGSVLGANNDFNINWSWDDRSLVIYNGFGGKSSEHLWVVSTSDGQRRDLSHSEGVPVKAVFSPDGRYVAYEIWRANATMTAASSSIFVVPAQGGEPRVVYESGMLALESRPFLLRDWTADGRFLVITDVRVEKSALYLLPMKNGTASGPAEFVRYGEFNSAYTTASGALVYEEEGTRPIHVGVFLTSLDSDGQLGGWRRLDLRSRLDGQDPVPSFSPDGNQIAYLAGDEDPARKDIVLRDLSTGQERVVYQSGSKSIRCQFSVRNPKLFCTESVDAGAGEKTDLISVGVGSGSVEHVASFQESRIILQSPQNDEIFYFSTLVWGFPPVVRWNRATLEETLVSAPSADERQQQPSYDGRWFVGTGDGSLWVRPIAGGDVRAFVSGITEVSPPETTPDGKWIYYHALDPAGKPSLFRVSIDGGTPQRLGDYPTYDVMGDTLHISPDGRKILAAPAEHTSYDLWVLDNFEPPTKK